MTDAAINALAAHWQLRHPPRKPGDRGRAICPAHGGAGSDRNLAVGLAPGNKLLLSCHSHGCGYETIMAALGIDIRSPGRSLATSRAPARRPPPAPPRQQQSGRKQARVLSLWRALRPIARSPGEAYLGMGGRRAWDPGHTALPDCIRWLSFDDAQRAGLRWHTGNGPPAGTIGMVAYGYSDAAGRITAVQFDALGPDGMHWPARPPGAPHGPGPWRWRQKRGEMGDSAMIIPGDSNAIAVCEGPVDALALGWWRGMEVWAPGGRALTPLTSRLVNTGRPIEIHADNNQSGELAAMDLLSSLRRADATARIVFYTGGDDPASALSRTRTASLS